MNKSLTIDREPWPNPHNDQSDAQAGNGPYEAPVKAHTDDNK